jgi:hypothetical protein
MLELIISAIFLISPSDSISVPFDITIVFDPPEDPKSVTVYLDGVEIEGEKDRDYFFKQINSLPQGEHSIKLSIKEEKREWGFIVIKGKEILPLDIWGNISLGMQNYYYSDTSYSVESGPIYGVDISLSKGNHLFNLSIFHDPDYSSEWYPFLSYSGNRRYLEMGYIYPFFDEITIYAPAGFGITGEIDIGFLTLTPIFLYSKSYDSLFIEYPRCYYGGKISLSSKSLYLGVTLYRAEDDTSDIKGFPFTSPQQSLVLAPEFKWQMTEKFSLKLKGGYSRGNDNLFIDTLISGNVIEGDIIYESSFNSITAGIRRVSKDYLTLGNQYLYTNRISTFLSGIYEVELFYTDFDHLAYKKDGNIGFSLMQTLKVYLAHCFSPIVEYQWAKYPEYKNEEYQYGAIGFESMFGDLQIYNTFGIYRYPYADTTSSLKLSSSLYWYPGDHSIGIGGAVSKQSDYVRFDLNMDLHLKLWELGYLEIYYYPSIEESYDKHSLRVVYECGF